MVHITVVYLGEALLRTTMEHLMTIALSGFYQGKKLYNIVWGFANSKNPKESTRTMTYIPVMNHSFRPYAMLPIMPAIGLSFFGFLSFSSRLLFSILVFFSVSS
ncbi:uncharacterized protein BDW43DRAFT_203891 [Aspergillus alliaceus]|uniref:uncharacterized protein n=1 Tax=Petromyces alliaceus TaxID=209559 RepID=UPI0012A74670|nr:uncharacterized protein BDW43DRAFT_203891 [Aspergillus alliaceus]KAB8237310.1 hypothetical protein BDW43DRAFT_203891 [Aspergillus alliaceus]